MDNPAPDTKDWTWVLERTCDQCGYNAASIEATDVAAMMRANAAEWRAVLNKGDIVGQRPPVAPGASPVWSALEYGAHVRDVYELSVERLTRMLKKKAPQFPDWNQDQAAIDGDYGSADAKKVGYDLAVQAGKMADLLDKVHGDQWERAGMRSDGAGFTVATFAVYMVHDVIHHLWDVQQGFEAISEAKKKG